MSAQRCMASTILEVRSNWCCFEVLLKNKHTCHVIVRIAGNPPLCAFIMMTSSVAVQVRHVAASHIGQRINFTSHPGIMAGRLHVLKMWAWLEQAVRAGSVGGFLEVCAGLRPVDPGWCNVRDVARQLPWVVLPWAALFAASVVRHVVLTRCTGSASQHVGGLANRLAHGGQHSGQKGMLLRNVPWRLRW